MPARRLQWEPQELPWEEQKRLREQLEKELDACTEIRETYRNKIKKFLVGENIWHIAEIDYQIRIAYESFLEMEVAPVSKSAYLKAFDRVKQHAIRKEMQTLSGRNREIQYKNQILFLPYHPDQQLAMLFEQSAKKEDLVWDFTADAPEKMKRQIFCILHYLIREYTNVKSRRRVMLGLRKFYEYCITEKVGDIESLELSQVEQFRAELAEREHRLFCIVNISRKVLFVEATEIHWNANVWYLERFRFEKTRVDPSKPVSQISFLEVQEKSNRSLLQLYMKYCLGLTHLSINNLRSEFLKIRNFLVWLDQNGTLDVRKVTEHVIQQYFRHMEQKQILPETFNDEVMAVVHFYNYLKSKGVIAKVPFHEQYYLKKTILKHNNRSVSQKAYVEILEKLDGFPEDLRLMFLHLWGLGLRAGEVCTLKGNAYYVQGRDAWIQVYQIKMKTYKRIPIPSALYKLMRVYIAKQGIQPEDYIFQNRKGGAYCYATFRKKMLEYCEKNEIENGEYLFKSHDYRHTIATIFYDEGVSIQGVRDYLGHEYEEMTRQYIDYMPKKIARANETYFEKQGSSLAADLKRCKRGE